MRVIAGCYRGRRLRTPAGSETRPILDRVKVGLFDWLGACLDQPGRLPRLDVLDLFSGAGSLGIEALSRGARSCTFVEVDTGAFACLEENLDTLGITASVAALFNGRAEATRITPPDGRAFGLIFLDPPYPLSTAVTPDSVMGSVMARLGREVPVTRDVLAVWRHAGKCVLPDTLPGGWSSSLRREWGTMAVTMLERTVQGSS